MVQFSYVLTSFFKFRHSYADCEVKTGKSFQLIWKLFVRIKFIVISFFQITILSETIDKLLSYNIIERIDFKLILILNTKLMNKDIYIQYDNREFIFSPFSGTLLICQT